MGNIMLLSYMNSNIHGYGYIFHFWCRSWYLLIIKHSPNFLSKTVLLGPILYDLMFINKGKGGSYSAEYIHQKKAYLTAVLINFFTFFIPQHQDVTGALENLSLLIKDNCNAKAN